MIDHISLHVSDYQKAKDFYLKALKPLGYELLMEFGEIAGMGTDGKADLWISVKESGKDAHLAFAAKDTAMVQAFYEAALAAGGKDNGAPGPRPDYGEHYYGAFVLDPDGNNIEAVCHI
jgi:catechol 2,3-dioxygenase-like lactoylglutathione lyase family enzyme